MHKHRSLEFKNMKCEKSDSSLLQDESSMNLAMKSEDCDRHENFILTENIPDRYEFSSFNKESEESLRIALETPNDKPIVLKVPILKRSPKQNTESRLKL